MSEDKLVKQLMKGIYNSRPPQPRYESTWSVERLLPYEETSGRPDFLPFKLLTWRTSTLLALASLLRASELAEIDLSSLSFSDQGASITLRKPRKVQHAGALKRFNIPSLPERENVCTVKCLERYVPRSMKLRSDSCKTLFICTTFPHGPASKSTIARWIKCFLKEAGIGCNTFKAHSTRSAAASHAWKSGIPIEHVLRMGDWSSVSTFRRFYQRPTV